MYVYQIITLYILNLDCVLSQLYLNAAGEKKHHQNLVCWFVVSAYIYRWVQEHKNLVIKEYVGSQ